MIQKSRPYQSDNYIKNANSLNQFKKGKQILLEKEISKQKKERLKDWITFYRHNIDYFCVHFLGIKLFPFQRYWLRLISYSTNFLGVASRASGKSWIIAVYSICRCILYPGTSISLNSSTKQQAGLIISQHCKSLHDSHPMIQRETDTIVINNNKWEMTFLNGSKIFVVISGEGGRGVRSHVSVLEERRLIPTEIIDSIIRPFLVSRKPPFIMKPEYAHLEPEEPQEIIITSSYFQSHEWWNEAKKLLRLIIEGDKDVKSVIFDYLIVLKHKIKTKKQIKKDAEKMDSITFLMEYGNIPYSASSSGFYKVEFFNRTLKNAWRPLKDDFSKKNPYDIPRKPNERRIVSVDIAMRKGSANDNTIISCARLFPTKNGWSTEICYIESQNGKNAMTQALRIKQIFSEFTGFEKDDILVLDVGGSGITVYDMLTSETKDDIRGKEYDAMKVMRHSSLDDKVYEELSERCLSQNAKECIYPISATQSLNSQIAVSFRDRLKRKLIKFLVDDAEEELFLIKSGNKDILDQEDGSNRSFLLSPHIQTTLMINECISLEMEVLGQGMVKLQEPPGARKDRFTSCSYLNWYVSFMDQELLKDTDDTSDWDALFGVSFIS